MTKTEIKAKVGNQIFRLDRHYDYLKDIEKGVLRTSRTNEPTNPLQISFTGTRSTRNKPGYNPEEAIYSTIRPASPISFENRRNTFAIPNRSFTAASSRNHTDKLVTIEKGIKVGK